MSKGAMYALSTSYDKQSFCKSQVAEDFRKVYQETRIEDEVDFNKSKMNRGHREPYEH